MGRANQGGSILSFVIIGGILTALLVGGAYAVQQRSETTTGPVAVQSTEQSEPTDKSPAPAEEKANDQPAPKQEEKPAPAPEKPQQAPATTPKPAPVKPQPAPAATPTPASPKTTSELPQTGPVETLGSLVGLGLLSAVSVAYVRSRRF